MEFLKKNLIIVICAIVSLLSLVAIFVGQSKIAGAKDVLAQAQKYINTIDTLQRGVPVTTPDGRSINLIPTDEAIKKLKEISQLYKAQGYQALEQALRINIGYDEKTKKNRRELLVDGVFPEPATPAKPFGFAKAYHQAIQNLPKRINGGDVPTQDDIERDYELISQDLGFLAEQAGSAAGTKGGGGKKKGYTEEDLRKSAQQKAILEKAQSIKVYCKVDVFDKIKEVYTLGTGEPPLTEDMWWAQLSYWLQTDILDAISATNADAKNVIDAPLKRILNIKMMHGYVTPEGFIGRDDPGLPDSFTDMASNKYYDVLRFSITVIIDSRQIPLFIDKMYKEGYYTMYLCKIASVTQHNEISTKSQVTAEDLYYYGPAPVVEFTSYWETYLLRDFYHWGIVGYGVNPKTGKTQLILYDGTKVDVDNIEDRKNLKGLMPKTIRELLTGEEGASTPQRRSRRRR